ncbi:MAG TPA: hypothetical protein VHE35_05115 [Kofleriaceae bacterium]|nr:hypothetical protein [Kofleriaceae bacterium]
MSGQRYTALGTVARSLDVWARNLGAALLLGALFFSPMIIYTAVLVRDLRIAGGLTEDQVTAWWIVSTLLAYGADQLLAAPIVYGVVQELNGTHAGVGACIVQGLRRFIPVVLTVILLYVCVLIAAYPFVVPAFVLATGMYVAVPSAVCERRGALRAVTRSLTLTEGSRMRVLGLLTLFWAVRIGAKLLLIRVIDPAGRPGPLQLMLIVSLAVDFLFGTVGAVMQAVTYSRLRELRDGTSTAELARIFE